MLSKIVILFGLIASTPLPVNYHEVWGADYTYAEQFVQTHYESFNAINTLYGLNAQEATAIVFPELLRYSLIKDFLETSALEVGYVNYGRGYGDFSIGTFQMKPSFIEQLENKVCNNKQLLAFQPLFTYKASDSKGIRKEMVVRMQNTAFQVQYLACFMSIAMLEHEELECIAANERVKLLATLYNAGLNKPMSTIKKLAVLRTFPYGALYLGTQYSYAAVAYDYYIKNEKEILN